MNLEINEDFYLTNPNSNELEECISFIVEVSDGLLQKIFTKVDIKQALVLVSGNDSPLFNCSNIHVIKSQKSGKIVAMLLGYQITNQSLPLILKAFINKEKIELLEKVLCHQYINSYYINTLYVAPECRGLGFASLLLDIAKLIMQQHSLKSIVLHCFKDNQNALNMYKSYGFEIVDTVNYQCLYGFKHYEGYICKFTPD